MLQLKSFFKLIRWPNLVFIILTQILFFYLVAHTVYNNAAIKLQLTNSLFFLLVIASVLIAAAGYIINDYFDVNIDLINKPEKLIISKIIQPRKAILWHLLFSLIGIVISFYISIVLQQRFWWLGWSNFLVVILLVVYSASFKKKLLIGNIVISFLTAWVILVIILSQFQINYFLQNGNDLINAKNCFSKLFRIGILYASFAFVITLMREVVKDMEDFIGDSKNNCKTMPIVWGFQVSKVFVAIWTIILILLLIILQIYVLQYQWFIAIVYSLILIIAPLMFSFKILIAATDFLHYHTLSNLYKIIMLTGILSMVFFKIYE